MNEDRFPLLVINGDGSVVAVSRTNSKAVAKSVEQHELWYLHPETERVLPWNGGGARFSSLEERTGGPGSEQSWYEVVLVVDARAANEREERIPPTKAATPVTGTVPSGKETSERERLGAVLYHLMEVVAARHRDMPEGSYTTHLFEKGTEKIRKKTGEEAVELLLARNSGELIYEAADLVYHMLVLFEGEGIPFASVVEELERRF